MINLKESLLRYLENNEILCAYVNITRDEGGEYLKAELKLNYTPEEYSKFMQNIDIEVDDFEDWVSSCVWLKDVNAILKYEWDESFICQHWYRRYIPQIPDFLKE